jgi:RND family efflux transporter MFP subunit
MDVYQTERGSEDPRKVPPVKKPAAGEPKPRRLGFGFFAILLAVAAVLGWYIYKGINQRVSAQNALVLETRQSAVLDVAVVHPKLTGASETLELPGNTQPLIDAPIYARTSGYLSKWYVDIGTRVKAGQLLAEIASPEVDHQLLQAKADLATAQTNLKLAQMTAGRYANLVTKGAVARQDADNVISDMKSKQTMVESAEDNVKRLEDLQSYEKVTAPFDGVITARNTDVGQLIDAGSAAPGKELFHISANNKLRVYINVPEIYDQSARNGSPATLTLNEFPGRVFHGTVVRNSGSIDPASRTLLVEVDVENPTGDLLPGAYVFVHLRAAGQARAAMTIPVSTVLFRSEGLRAAVVRNNRAVLVPIQVGRDYGDSLEVVAGLRPNESLIVNPPDSLISGTPVKVTEAQDTVDPSTLRRK